MVSKRRNSLCTLCYKPATHREENNETGNLSRTKFLYLLLRHLKMQPKLDKFKNEFMCCEDCALLANSFCDLYFQRECIKLQLEWKLRKVYKTMVCAERVASRVNAFRTQFKSSQDEQECDDDKPSQNDFKEIQAARKRLIKNCKLKLKSSKPRVLLQRIANNRDYSTGLEVKSEKVSPKKLNTSCHDGRVPDFEMLMETDCNDSFECDTRVTRDPELNTLLPSPCQDNDDGSEYYEDDEGILEEMDSDQETCEDKISSGMDVQNVSKIDTSDMKRHKDCQIEKTQRVVGDGDGPIVTETLNHSQMTECSSSIPETPLQLPPEIPSFRVEMSTPHAVSVDTEESRVRKSLRSLLRCVNCSKTFTNKASMDLHVKLHEENIIHDQPSESDNDPDSSKNEEVVGDTEFTEDEDEEVDVDEHVEHSDVNVDGCSESETELPPRAKSRGRPVPGPHNKPRTAKLPFTQCEICLVNYDCEAAVEKCRVVNHKLHKYVCCHSCKTFFNCHRHIVRHRKEQQKCFPKNPSDLEPAAAPLFPSSRPIIGNKFCTVEGCYEVFRYEELLNVHLKTHGKWDCTLCPAEFGKAHELAVHELNEHKNQPAVTAAEARGGSKETVEKMSKKIQIMAKKSFSCTRCNKSFDKIGCRLLHFVYDHLGIPKAQTLGKVSRQCEICKNPFDPRFREKQIKAHIESQHNVEGMNPMEVSKCSICQAPFRLRIHLTNHMRLVHKQKSQYKCPYCVKQYDKISNFQSHLHKIHKGKPSGLPGAFECKICKERVSNENKLKSHMKKHEDDDKIVFKCETCQKTFSKRVNLNNHVKNVHEQPKRTWHCEKCAKVFKTRVKLDQHTSYTHTDPSQWKFGCPEEGCGKRCWSRQKLTEHIRTHTKERPFICDFCGEAYRFRQYLRTHLAKVHGETAAKTLPTQQYTKPFDQELKEKLVTEESESGSSMSLSTA
ncbi:unnamed protein product [Orchesella dallaii]|uniref:C2H2-type domain-containing protein n=1 Tax=Orchesella dallaii TaxID=48710 RepID=A0ABP1S569_9HEXA